MGVVVSLKKNEFKYPEATEPLFELRVKVLDNNEYEMEIWQIPSPVSPNQFKETKLGRIVGAPFRVLETWLIRKLGKMNVSISLMKKNTNHTFMIKEDHAMFLTLLFLSLTSLRKVERIREVAMGVESLTYEESSYWVAMALHKKKPRRVLAALRMLLS